MFNPLFYSSNIVSIKGSCYFILLLNSPRIKSSAVCNAQLHIQCELIWKKSLMFYSTDRMQAGSKVLVWSISGKRPCGTSLNKKNSKWEMCKSHSEVWNKKIWSSTLPHSTKYLSIKSKIELSKSPCLHRYRGPYCSS